MTEPESFATPERAEAHQLRTLYAAAMHSARNDKDLTTQARNRTIADLHAEGRARLDKLRQADRQRLGAEAAQRRKELFGGLRRRWNAPESDAVSIRDAQDRADQLKSPAEAAALLQRAQSNNDRALEAAIGQVAADRAGVGPAGDAWTEVARAYVAADPGHRQPLVERLAELEDLVDPAAGPLSGVLGDEFTIAAPPEARRGGGGDSVGGNTGPSVGGNANPSVHS